MKGLDKLNVVLDATSNHQPMSITYRNYKGNGKEEVVLLHPYFVKQYNNRWFLFGLHHHRNQISNLALDRMIDVKIAENIKFIPNKDIDFNHYFDDVVGVTIPHDDVAREHVVLHFSKQRFPYVTSKPIHHSQEIINEDECLISIDVRPNQELIALLLSFGSDVEIVAPTSLKESISEKIKEIYKKYFAV